jgi:hypothetical protein
VVVHEDDLREIARPPTRSSGLRRSVFRSDRRVCPPETSVTARHVITVPRQREPAPYPPIATAWISGLSRSSDAEGKSIGACRLDKAGGSSSQSGEAGYPVVAGLDFGAIAQASTGPRTAARPPVSLDELRAAPHPAVMHHAKFQPTSRRHRVGFDKAAN